ncbi:energy transducer TonB [Winogradskyella algicola]|uniref:energy transducer TonB n=1 Tax=Winogradskyella algicola TaxID=2575815 RepID=UPI0011081D8A|nr:energy transducer TonB [Winogradskyella algicola]
MKNSKKNLNSTGQSTAEVRKPQKHDANLQKNSTLYFQIGLILCLLATYGLFEMQFQEKKVTIDAVEINDVATIDVAPDYRVEEVVQKKNEPKVERSTELKDVYKEVENNTPDVEQKIFTPDDPKPSDQPITRPEDIVVEKIPEPVDVPFYKIEKAPIYPGCEKKKTNADRKKCMSDKISKLVSKRFNTDVASDHGISGLQKIQTQFTVDKNGNITNVKIRTPHPVLEKEALRVINKIPMMKPGYQQDKPVGVIYNLPIKFMVRD